MLQSKIQAAGHRLAEDESAIYELRELIEQDDNLSRFYEHARIEL